MKTKTLYKSQFKEYFKKILSFRDYDIYDVEHSVARYKERVGKDIFLYEKLLKKGINYLIKNNIDQVEDRYVWYSKKYGFGIQVHWRPDRNTNQFAGFTATTLSEDEMKFFTQKDKKVLLENINKYIYPSQSSIDVFENGFFTFDYPTQELKEEMDSVYYNMYVILGEIYYDFELIKF